MVVDFLNLVRWKNLLITGVTIFLIKYAVFHPAINHLFPLSESTFGFTQTLLLVVSVMLIAGAGYIINDINDLKADSINKPDKIIINKGISMRTANGLYFALNIAGILLAAYLGKEVGTYKLALLHVLTAGILWVYSSFIKNSFLIGNILVALTSALVPLTYFLFEGIGYVQEYGFVLQKVYLSKFGGPLEVLINYSIVLAAFGFIISLIREIIKDIQDAKGDSFVGANTLPIALNQNIAKAIVIGLSLAMAMTCVYFLHFKLILHPFNKTLFIIYSWALVISPIGYLIYLIKKSNEPNEFQQASNVCKFIMLTGILTTIIYSISL